MPDFFPLNTVKRLRTGKLSPQDATTLGRFELRRMLGQGAQSVVWLAFDPRLEREVALKLMKLDDSADANTVVQWLREARSVSRLTHPNIVPVFEADVHDSQPYLVFEYVAGQTLAARLKASGAWPVVAAVQLMLEILDALSAAHALGVIHRDLKPSNVVIDGNGRARVMDFGIAAKVGEVKGGAGAEQAVGTPGYMSPEAARGLIPAPVMDVFSAAVVLTELLSGRPLIAEKDPYRAIYRVVHEQQTLPASLASDVDDALRSIIMHALARDPQQRFANARAFHDALTNWAARFEPAASPADAGTAQGKGALDFLLRRMRHKTDFPAMSDAIVRIQGMANSDRESVGSITNEILKDVALTNKLLRLVNSAHYARGGNISTVSRAVTLVGLNGIRNMTLSLVLLEHMQDKAHANQLKEEFLRSLMAGSIAGELCPLSRDAEEAFIASTFQNLGRLLAEYYFPEEAKAVRARTSAGKDPRSEEAAATSVLGLSYEELGVGVARAWGLPAGIQRCMAKPAGDPPSRAPDDPQERMRWMALAANDIADSVLHCEPKALQARLEHLAKRYGRTLGVAVKDVHAATSRAQQKLVEMAQSMDLRVTPGSPAARLLQLPAQDEVAPEQATAALDTLAPLELHATNTGSPPAQALAESQQVADVLTAGIQDITNAMVESFRLSDVLRMILETMFRALAFQRVVFCMRDAKTDVLTGRFGLGLDVERAVASFKVPLKSGEADLFAVVCQKGADTMISDATEPRLAQRLPAWYRQTINAPTFLILPLQLKGKPFGLIYADKAKPGGLNLSEKELSLLRTLRNQALMAFRQSG